MGAPEDVRSLLDEVAGAASASGRPDLADRVAAGQARLDSPEVCVVVAGEFKAGKSSLVNALVGADVCPVDDDISTSVPTLVRYAPEPGLRVRREANGADGADGVLEIGQIATYATEAGNPGNREQVMLVEVGLPAEVLRTGLVLVDTPGVGGLRSTYASATMTALAMASAMVFVSDASQEYTRPELDFLAAARRVCPEIVAVLSKVDLVPEWRKVFGLDEGWLAEAGVDAPVVATSAALHLQGHRQARDDLRAESGMAVLVDALAAIAGRTAARIRVGVLDEVATVLGQLGAPLRAEHDALADPAATIDQLRRAADRARELTGDADWAALLEDGIVDLEAAVDRDMAARMKAVLADATRTVESTDPATNWEDFEAALTAQVSSEVSAVAVELSEAAGALASRLAEEFAQYETAIAPAMSTPAELLPAGAGLRSGVRAATWRGVLVDAGWGGLEALGVLGSILTFTSISLFNPFSLVIGVFIGGKTLRDSRRRELERRREQAQAAVAQYVQDAVEVANRELKTTTRRIRRELHTTYQRRADALLRSAQASLAAAERTIGGDASQVQARRQALAGQLVALEALAVRAEALR